MAQLSHKEAKKIEKSFPGGAWEPWALAHAKINCLCPRCKSGEYEIIGVSADGFGAEFLKCKQCGYEGELFFL
ncbi:MAG: hypothetical protein GWO87_02755 [Xanthomonadaceae bacterium]|nr:hypothetical protein [Rhodospirillaceae bacterium]NIA18082.1 hypothetical protein [Xanthomonadaceae bacterium]